MLLILTLSGTLRLWLIHAQWPAVNADESIIDLMARHILYQGEHPIFFWGQNYMGTLQAYLGAGLMHFFGSSIASVRLGTLLLFLLYLASMYALVRLLYSSAFALLCIALLSIGSDRMIGVLITANGGYAETMLCGALLFLLVSHLALTLPDEQSGRTSSRLLAYAALGFVLGLGLWSDQLILAAALTGGVFLLVCCHREMRGLVLCALLAGLLVGATPLLLYNLQAPLPQNSLFVLLGTVFTSAPRIISFAQQLAEALLISLPHATGLPFTLGGQPVCGNVEPYTHALTTLASLFPTERNPWFCFSTRGGWSLGILLLWSGALLWALVTASRLRSLARREAPGPLTFSEQARRQRVRLYASLMLLSSGAIWLLLFACGQAAPSTPRGSSRYLIGLLLSLPAVLWPLWLSLTHPGERLKSGQRYVRTRFVVSALALLTIVCVYTTGTIEVLSTLPANQGVYARTNAVVQTLLTHGITRLYSDYDTCSVLIFRSDERVLCIVLDNRLQAGNNRYAPYTIPVSQAPHPAYLFPVASPANQVLAHRLSRDTHYRHLVYAGYSIYYYIPPDAGAHG
jgi:hypothetical protein